MKIQDIEKKHPAFDKPAGEAAYLIDTGKFAEYVEPKFTPAKPAAELVWQVRTGHQAGDYQYPPYLFASCPACGQKWWTEPTGSSIGNSDKSLKIFHCGQKGVVCPPAVATLYQAKYADWKSRSRKVVEKISPHTPEGILRRQGVKTSEQLRFEALASIRQLQEKQHG